MTKRTTPGGRLPTGTNWTQRATGGPPARFDHGFAFDNRKATRLTGWEPKVLVREKIPLIAGEGDSVERGALITQGLDYEQLGRQTGEMAVRILKDGEDPAAMPVESQEDTQLIINLQAAERMGVEVPQELQDTADQVIE